MREGVWVNHRTLTSQPHPVPYNLTHAPPTPDILPTSPPLPPPAAQQAFKGEAAAPPATGAP